MRAGVYSLAPLLQVEPIFQQVALEEGRTLGVAVIVDVVSLARLLGAVLHDDALEPRLALQSVEHAPLFLADGVSPLLAFALQPLSILAWVLAPHDAGRVLSLALVYLLPHSGGGLSAGFRRLTTSQGVVVAVFLAGALDMMNLSALDALHALGALGEVHFTGESVERGKAHAACRRQSAVLLFGEPSAEPRPLLVGEHQRLDMLTACPSRLRGEWSVNEMRSQHTGKWFYLHSYSFNSWSIKIIREAAALRSLLSVWIVAVVYSSRYFSGCNCLSMSWSDGFCCQSSRLS